MLKTAEVLFSYRNLSPLEVYNQIEGRENTEWFLFACACLYAWCSWAKTFFPSVCGAASHPITERPQRRWGMMPASWVVWLLLHTVGRWFFSKLVWALLILNISYSPCQYKTTSQYNPLQSYAGQSAQAGIDISLLVLRVVAAWHGLLLLCACVLFHSPLVALPSLKSLAITLLWPTPSG